MALFTENKPSQTVFGSDKDGGAGAAGSIVAINAKLGQASGLILVDSAGTEYVLWVDPAGGGKLQIGTYAAFQLAAGGTTVGTQT